MNFADMVGDRLGQRASYELCSNYLFSSVVLGSLCFCNTLCSCVGALFCVYCVCLFCSLYLILGLVPEIK